MPQFEIDLGTPKAAQRFRSLSTFAAGYVTAMFFTGAEDRRAERADISLSLLSDAEIDRIESECDAFEEANSALLDAAEALDPNCDRERAGRDFWFTRTGCGAGFWDGDWPEPMARQLTEAATAAGTRDLYLGDDDTLYLYPPPMPQPAHDRQP